MREIIYRAWDGKHMWEVIKLLMGAHGGVPFQATGIRFLPDMQAEIKVMNICYDECEKEAHHCSLLQYTGLKDKYGVPIFEGDVCRYIGERNLCWKNGVIRFDNCAFRIHAFVLFELKDEIDVIGNVYESPELLK